MSADRTPVGGLAGGRKLAPRALGKGGGAASREQRVRFVELPARVDTAVPATQPFAEAEVRPPLEQTLGLSSTMTHVKAISDSIAYGRGIAHSS